MDNFTETVETDLEAHLVDKAKRAEGGLGKHQRTRRRRTSSSDDGSNSDTNTAADAESSDDSGDDVQRPPPPNVPPSVAPPPALSDEDTQPVPDADENLPAYEKERLYDPKVLDDRSKSARYKYDYLHALHEQHKSSNSLGLEKVSTRL